MNHHTSSSGIFTPIPATKHSLRCHVKFFEYTIPLSKVPLVPIVDDDASHDDIIKEFCEFLDDKFECDHCCCCDEKEEICFAFLRYFAEIMSVKKKSYDTKIQNACDFFEEPCPCWLLKIAIIMAHHASKSDSRVSFHVEVV
jgi:hypothetical protein